MNHLNLKKHLIALATLPETRSPLISAYFDLTRPFSENRADLVSWAAMARHSYQSKEQQEFDDALEEVQEALDNSKSGKSLVVFSRWGEHPMVMPIVLHVPVEGQFHAGSLPVIFPLIEARDRFHRFVLVATDSTAARIFEINLGDISENLLAKRPELRERLGREWTREHYQNHRRERDERFVKEKVAVIEKLMNKRGHNHLILAGEPRFISRLKDELPKQIAEKVSGEIRTGVNESNLPAVVQQSMEVFLEQEKQESHDAVLSLEAAMRSGGLAAIGLEAVEQAIEYHQADELVLSSEFPKKDRERLVRLAAQQDIPVETVQGSETLERIGGVGCLLRYLPAGLENSTILS